MEQSKKRKSILLILGVVGVVSILTGVSLAFFNYTRTGSPNNIAVGNIYFSSSYEAVTLENVFPTSKENILTDTNNVMTINVSITGNTSYPGGIDYKVTASNVLITTNGKQIPLSVNVTSSDLPANSVALYSYEDGAILQNDSEFAVGHIPPNTNVNGTITLRVYIDGDKVAISDTLEDGPIVETGYVNGTTSNWVNGRTVLTTSEWNNIQSSGIGFKVKVSADEGVYDPSAVGYLTYNKNQLLGSTPTRQSLKGDGTDKITASLDVPNFKGWSTTPTGDVEYKLGDTINFNSDTTLYAVIKEPQKAHEFLQERKTTQATCISIEPNKSSFYGDIDADVIYYTGNSETCLKNYVWYSGKLWRIVAIYPNGMMKLVTENPMTAIQFGSTVTFDGSWMDQWLSQEFLPTLYNNENIVVQNAEWNVTETTANTDPYLLSGSATISKTVGLLNAFEYTKSGTGSGYLHIGQYWWLMTPYSSSNVRSVNGSGSLNYASPSLYANGARPSIVIKSSAVFDTENYDGTRLSPFHIVGDIEEGQSGDSLTTRVSGEYVKFNNELYRIVGIENNTTKIVKTDYIQNPNSSNSDKYLGYFGSDKFFSTKSANNTFWDYYLTDENGWLSTLSDTSLLVQGTYYQGYYPSNSSYKSTICAAVNDGISTKDCTKISGTNMTYTGLVGLLRAGEMMSAQQSTLEHINSYSNYKIMWLITPYSSSSSNVRSVNVNGYLNNNSPSSGADGARPSVHLKSGAKIADGSGFINDPYEVE